MKRLALASLFMLLLGVVVVAQQDVIVPLDTPPADAAISISYPPPVYVVRGAVQVRGTAASGNLSNYFLEFRPLLLDPTRAESTTESLNPWFPATLPANQVVQNGVLGTWNTTTAPDGLYELRLTVNITGATPQHFRVSPIRIENNPPDFVPITNPGRPGLLATPTQLPGAPLPRPTLRPTEQGFNPNPRVTALVDSNVRVGDSTAYERVGALLTNETAPIIGISSTGSGWYYIELDTGRRGFIAPSIVRADGVLSGLPRINPPPIPTPTLTPTPPAVADLLIDGFRLEPAQPVCDEPFTAFMNVTNADTGASGREVTVLLTDTYAADGTQNAAASVTIPSLQPGANFVAVIALRVSTFFEETHRLRATVDSGGVVTEIKEDNNTFTRTYTLARGDC